MNHTYQQLSGGMIPYLPVGLTDSQTPVVHVELPIRPQGRLALMRRGPAGWFCPVLAQQVSEGVDVGRTDDGSNSIDVA